MRRRSPPQGDGDTPPAYSRQLATSPTLGPVTQTELAREYHTSGDVRIRNLLVTANLRLVLKVAHEYASRREDLMDLVQEGNAGLIKAIERFDPSRGVRLSSFAMLWIRAYILKYLLENSRAVKVGSTREQRSSFFSGQVGPSDVSLDETPAGEENTTLRRDSLPAPDELRPDWQTEARELRTRLANALTRLQGSFERPSSARARAVMAILGERWLADEPRTLTELGAELSVSRERVRQVECRMLDDLRAIIGVAGLPV